MKKRPKPNEIDVIDSLDQYYYFNKTLFDRLCKTMGSQEFFKVVEEASKKNALRCYKHKSFDETKLMRYDWHCNLFYGIFSNIYPVSLPYRIDYIGGITNKYFDLKKAEKLLQKCKYVTDIEVIDIPYYNCYDGHSKAVEFIVHLPQKEYNKLVDRIKDLQFPLVSLRELMVYRGWNENDPDVLGIKPARKDKSEEDY